MALTKEQLLQTLPRLLKDPGLLVREPCFIADAILLWGFIAPVPHMLIVPTLLYAEYTNNGFSKRERNLLVGQEIINLLLGFAIHSSMFILGGFAAKKLFTRLNPLAFQPKSRNLKDAETLACLIGAFIGSTFIKPVLSATLLKDEMKPSKHGHSHVKQQPQTALPRYQYVYPPVPPGQSLTPTPIFGGKRGVTL